jgi:hypothetical protein
MIDTRRRHRVHVHRHIVIAQQVQDGPVGAARAKSHHALVAGDKRRHMGPGQASQSLIRLVDSYSQYHGWSAIHTA